MSKHSLKRNILKINTYEGIALRLGIDIEE